MSRSIHANRSRRLLEQHGFRDWADIWKKRRIKRTVQEDRERDAFPDLADFPVPGFGIPITIMPDARALFFPATEKDIRCVLDRLPSATTNGLFDIVLEAGTAHNEDLEDGMESRDPLIGRRGEEFFPGVFIPDSRGTYEMRTNRIRIFGFVKVPGATLTESQEMELRFQMLETLVHEAAHHYDRAHRSARGRWRMDDRQKFEEYADVMTDQWCDDVVMPYLLERYGSG